MPKELIIDLSNSATSMTLNDTYNPDLKGTPLFDDEYLRNGTR